MPRLYREAPVNSIWEGSGNVQCLDVMRAMAKTPGVTDAFIAELTLAAGNNRYFDSSLEQFKKDISTTHDFEYQGRHLVERMAKLMQAAQLILSDNDLVADAFCNSRLSELRGLNYGNLPSGIDCLSIIERARPRLDASKA